MQAKNWCFTWNNPDGCPDPDLLAGCTYMVAQMEIGESGTCHYQGYVQMQRSVKLGRLREWLPKAHWEPSRGTPTEARNYCTKEESRLEPPIEWGVFKPTGQGSRSDLLLVKARLDAGARIVDLVQETDFFATVLRNHRALEWYSVIKPVDVSAVAETWVFVGPSGVGKTTLAKALRPTWFALSPDTNWWNGYTDQECVIFDEFNGKAITMESFNMLYDGTRYLMPSKGGHVACKARVFAFTSNHKPEAWWVGAYFAAFQRRVTKWVVVRELGTPIECTDYYDFQDKCNGL